MQDPQTSVDTAANEQAVNEVNPEQSVENHEARVAALEVALEEAKAQVLYVKAEGENIRRRALDDIDKARKFALEKFSSELLAVKDLSLIHISEPTRPY